MKEKNINKEKNFISIVVYLQNNENDIQTFLKSFDNYFEDKFDAYEFILVDDFSTDETKNKIREVSESINGNIVVIDLAYRHGLETAMLAGTDFAIGDFVYEFDSPIINYNLTEIMNVYKKSLEGYDIVAASPNTQIELSSRLFYSYLNKVSQRRMELTTECFRIVSRRALNRVFKNKEKLRYRKALYHYSGFKTFIHTYEIINNEKPKVRLNLLEKMQLGSDVLVNFSNIGMRIAINISLFFILMTLLVLGYTIYSYFTLDNIQLGWTTTMLFLSGSFSGVFLILAVLAKYMTVIISEVKDKPSYVFKVVERLSRK